MTNEITLAELLIKLTASVEQLSATIKEVREVVFKPAETKPAQIEMDAVREGEKY